MLSEYVPLDLFGCRESRNKGLQLFVAGLSFIINERVRHQGCIMLIV